MEKILDGSEVNLYPITQDLIDKLYEDKVIPSDSERAERYDYSNDAISEVKKRNIKFNSTKYSLCQMALGLPKDVSK